MEAIRSKKANETEKFQKYVSVSNSRENDEIK